MTEKGIARRKNCTYNPLVFKSSEPPALFSVLVRTLDIADTNLDGTYEILQLGSSVSGCDTDALSERSKSYFHKISGIKLVSTIISASLENHMLSETEKWLNKVEANKCLLIQESFPILPRLPQRIVYTSRL